ncbi:MAG: GNAT family N-acetyltransferase [Reyranellales bacterium]
MNSAGRQLQTDKGPVTLRPERPDDEALLFRLFRSWALEDLEHMPVDAATKENLVRFQFAGQMATYRARFAAASFDIIERHGVAVGRLIVDPGNTEEPACLVDFVLLPEVRNDRLGRAIISAVLAEQASLGRKVRVKILWHNEPSQRMCSALGFVEIGREAPFIQLEWSAPRTTA